MSLVLIQEKNTEIERLHKELSKFRDQTEMSEYQTCLEENTQLRRKTAQLQLEFDLVRISY